MLCPRVVGRADESHWLSAALDALDDGRGGCRFVLGEAGIGKSRLVEETLTEAAARGVWVLAGRASPTRQAVPYQSLSGAVLYGLRSRPLESVSEEVPGVRAGLAALLPGLVEGPVVEASPVLLGETVLRLARALAGEDGTLIVLEDLHWSCADTLAVIEYLVDCVATERVLIVATARLEGAVMPLIDSLERRAAAAVRVLSPLRPADVDEVAASCLDVDRADVPPDLARVLETRAEGIPFLVEELLAGIVSSGALVTSDGGWELRGRLEAVNVPLSFAQTVRERLAQLTPPEQLVVRTAAVLGRDFDWCHLPAMTDVGDSSVLEALSHAVELQLVENTGSDRFRFRHALTVDAVLADMLEPQRARLAGAALDDLLDDPGWGSSDLLEVAAHLAMQAGRTDEAAGYLTEDARRALASGAVATAVATARRACEISARDQPERIAAAEVLLSALTQAGDIVGVDEVGRALLARIESSGGGDEVAARTRLLLARAANAGLDLARARVLCNEAVALRPGDVRLRAELELMLAEIDFSAHEHAAAVARAERVLADADAAGLPDLACDALELIGRHRMFVALELREAEPILVEALERAERARLPLTRLRVLQRLAFHDLATGRDRARTEEGRALSLDLGALASAVEFDHLLATQCLIANELDSAAVCIDRALQDAGRYGLVELRMLLLALRGTIAAIQGSRGEAEQLAAEAAGAASGLPVMRAGGQRHAPGGGCAGRRRSPRRRPTGRGRARDAAGPDGVLAAVSWELLRRRLRGPRRGRRTRAGRGAGLGADRRRLPALELLRCARDRRRPRRRARASRRAVRRGGSTARRRSVDPRHVPALRRRGRSRGRLGRPRRVAHRSRGVPGGLRERAPGASLPIPIAARRHLPAPTPSRIR